MADEDRASGDASVHEDKAKSPSPEPEPPKIPDVELIVDGFGFMPSYNHKNKGKGSSRNFKDAEEESVTISSTNIDIVRRYTWRTKNRMTVQLISYGATFTSIQVPDRKGVPDDVLAGFDTLEEYFQNNNPYFGATIGRYANYVYNGTMSVKPSGKLYMLSLNKGYHHYHGGHLGFDKVNWRSYVSGNKVIMSNVSERFHEGYPGTLMTQITFEVTCDNTIKIDMKCSTSEPTVVNLSNSPFFNLAGHHSGKETLYDHIFTINADKYTPVDEDNLITGEKKVVGGTAFDFRVPRLLRVMLPKIPLGGYDLNYCITQGIEQDLTFQARVCHPGTGRVLEVYSNQPGLQFYTGNLLPDPDKIVEPIPEGEGTEAKEEEEAARKEVDDAAHGEESENETVSEEAEEALEEEREGKKSYGYVPLYGKQGTAYKKHGLFCLMPQNYPDAVNHNNFPSAVLNPGEVYIHRIQYKFGLLLGRYV